MNHDIEKAVILNFHKIFLKHHKQLSVFNLFWIHTPQWQELSKELVLARLLSGCGMGQKYFKILLRRKSKTHLLHRL